MDVLTFCCVVLKEIYSTTRSSGTSREKKDGVMLGVCFSRLLRRSHSDGLSWIDGASAGSNVRREEKIRERKIRERKKEGVVGGDDTREMEDVKRKE